MSEVPAAAAHHDRAAASAHDDCPATPTDRLAAVDAELADIDDLDLAEQVTAFDRMHSALTTALAATVDRPGRGDADGSGQPSLPYEER